MFKSFLLIFLLGGVLISGKARRRKHYDMNCDCGQRKDDELSRKDCEESGMLEEKISGGCFAGHVPWYVYFWIHQQSKCGGVLINKVREEAETEIKTNCICVSSGFCQQPTASVGKHILFPVKENRPRLGKNGA